MRCKLSLNVCRFFLTRDKQPQLAGQIFFTISTAVLLGGDREVSDVVPKIIHTLLLLTKHLMQFHN